MVFSARQPKSRKGFIIYEIDLEFMRFKVSLSLIWCCYGVHTGRRGYINIDLSRTVKHNGREFIFNIKSRRPRWTCLNLAGRVVFGVIIYIRSTSRALFVIYIYGAACMNITPLFFLPKAHNVLCGRPYSNNNNIFQCAVTNFILWSSGKCCLRVGALLAMHNLTERCALFVCVIRYCNPVVVREPIAAVMRFCSTWTKLFWFGVRSSSAHGQIF